MSDADYLEELKSKLGTHQHVIEHWHKLSDAEKDLLSSEIASINFMKIDESFELTKTVESSKLDDISPPSYKNFGTYKDLQNNQSLSEKYTYNAIQAGKVAVILLAGGQGTRLGVSYPKGMYNIDLPSNKTLYQLQAERLICLIEIIKKNLGGDPIIPWYIMTSEHTQAETVNFFQKNEYFGYDPMNVIFFEQYTSPCFDFDGKVIMENPKHIAKAADGNGGLYKTLRERRILTDMKRRGIEYLQIYCVDNVLVRMADPNFIGFCISKDLDCAAKVVEKIIPTEPIGILVLQNSKYKVVEYSEISLETAKKMTNGEVYVENSESNERLMYHCGNICIHFMNFNFLERISQIDIESKLPYHVAKKKIPYWNSILSKTITPEEPNGIKLEKFIFDVFPYSKNFGIWEVSREEEFAPLKNADTAKNDCPSSCRTSLLNLHKKWAENCGARIGKDSIIEISPLISSFGENLDFLKSKSIENVIVIEKDNKGDFKTIEVNDWKK